MKGIGYFFVVTGLLLLMIACAGHRGMISMGHDEPRRNWERFDPELAKTIRSFSDLLDLTRKKFSEKNITSDPEKMNVLFDVVTDRFTHDDARHTIFSNWILYISGFIHPTLSHIWDPDLMIRQAHALLCDQASYLLLRLAMEQGIRCRHVGLDGHVVMEAWYYNEWHLYDPDLEVIPKDDSGYVLSVEKLSHESSLLKKYYALHGIEQIVASRENNSYVSYPPGAWFEWKSNVLANLEPAMQFLKFAMPIVFMMIGMRVFVKSRRPQSRRSHAK